MKNIIILDIYGEYHNVFGQCLESKILWSGLGGYDGYYDEELKSVQVPTICYVELWKINGLEESINVLKFVQTIIPNILNPITPHVTYKIVGKNCEIIKKLKKGYENE